jgi:TP901 family phage tail tape measure protein
MAALVGALRAMLTLDSAAFVSGAERARKSSGRLESRLQSLATAARRIGAGMAIAAGALSVAIKGQLNAADEMGKAAQKFGVGVEELSRLKYAADLSDVSLETLGTGLRNLSKNMVAAGNGSKAQAQLFADMGVSVTDAAGQMRSAEAVMQDVADVLARMPDGAEKTALALRLFGKSGTDLIPMLNGGKAGLQEMAAEANRLGVVIDSNTAKSAENFNDNITRLGMAMQGLVMQITAALAPTLEKLSQWAVDVANAFGQLTPETRAMIVQVGAIVGVVGLAAGAFALLSAAISPVTIAVAAVAAGAMLIYENWDGIAAWFSEQWATIKTATVEAWAAIKESIGGAITYVTGLWDTFMGKITAAIETAKRAGQAIAEAMKFDPGSATNQFSEDFGMPDPGASYGAGSDAADGLVEGFKNQVVKRQGEIDEVADQITARVRNRWQIQSPSRVFREIGQFLSEGLGLGIRDGQPQVESAMDTVGEAIDGKADSLTSKLESFKSTAQNAFVGLVTGAMTFKQAIGQVASQLAQMAAQAAFQQLFGGAFKEGGFLGKLFGGLFANGAAFANGRVTAFASGGVVQGATAFAMQGGLGVMGEAGPEAIMPLARGRGGKLGVVAQGGAQRVQIEITENPMFASRVEGIADQRAVQVTRTYDRNVAPQTRNRNQRERG